MKNDIQNLNSQRIIRRPEVEKLTGLARSTIYDLMKKRKFPKSIQISVRAIGWLEADITAFIEERISESRKGGE
ncbi:AlpA family transcriptional regulator [Seleniivibrio sp.]|uniref:helix-turn-helix transcriptional regulator n=1 Tax=Seleniivibrio sp. TaxID=2898801 RepID=UPI0025E9AEFD|nr:AlpA family transcriptional regulator [Seleniivibrio sp.]MCD8554128.1 AlpA family transcriptional regulator [Seleniivibrio sp.]